MGKAGGYDRGNEIVSREQGAGSREQWVWSSLGLVVLFFVSACKFNPNVQGKGADFLQGKWEQEQVLYQDQLLTSTKHDFYFTCDSVYTVLTTTSKVNPYTDNCFNGGQWKEYAKGTYRVSNDSLFITATFTHANYKQKLSGCYRIGQYLPIFIVKKHTADSVQLQSLRENTLVNLSLKEKITCNPKPL